MRISYSAMDSFQNCPAKYKFSEIDKIKTSKSKEAVFGTLIHLALHLIHDPKNTVPPTEEQILKFFTDSWNKSVYPTEAEEAIAFEQGIKILKNYYAKNYPTKFHIIDLESFFEAPIEDKNETHFVTGIIDRIDKLDDGMFEIVDYKTSRSLPGQKKIDENLQLAIYHLGILNRWPNLAEKPIKLSLYFVKHGEKLSTFKKAADAQITKEKIMEIIAKIKESDFSPEPNPLCDWCNFQRYCPYFSHKFKDITEAEAIDEKKIKSAVDEFLKIKESTKKDAAKIAELAGLINQYCDQNKLERVFGNNGYISRNLQERYDYDGQKMLDILKAMGKLNEFLAVDLKKLSKNLNTFTKDEKDKIESARTAKKIKVLSAKKN